MNRLLLLTVGFLVSLSAAIAQPQPLTYCNPMDISYHYNFEQLNEKILR